MEKNKKTMIDDDDVVRKMKTKRDQHSARRRFGDFFGMGRLKNGGFDPEIFKKGG